MSVLIAGRNTAQLDRLKALADSATGHLPLIVRSISEVRRHLDEQCFDALILDFDSFEDAAVEVEILGFLEGLSERNQVRRLIFLSGQGLPLTVSPVSQLLLASHCHPATPDQQIGEMLCAQPNGTSLKQFRGLSRFQVGAGDGSYWTYSPEMRSILSQLESMAKHDVTILLIGETGSGKSHLARVIHQMSHRNSAKCHSVACGALPSDVIESELSATFAGLSQEPTAPKSDVLKPLGAEHCCWTRSTRSRLPVRPGCCTLSNPVSTSRSDPLRRMFLRQGLWRLRIGISAVWLRKAASESTCSIVSARWNSGSHHCGNVRTTFCLWRRTSSRKWLELKMFRPSGRKSHSCAGYWRTDGPETSGNCRIRCAALSFCQGMAC